MTFFKIYLRVSYSIVIPHLVTINIYGKNPAYGRHQISWPMRIVGPIQFWELKWKKKMFAKKSFFLGGGTIFFARRRIFLFCFFIGKKMGGGKGGTKFGSEGGLTNQRPWTDHVMWGPMRGLNKSYMKRGQKDTHRDSMKESAMGRFFENITKNLNFMWMKKIPGKEIKMC